jgi:hypothetical protein
MQEGKIYAKWVPGLKYRFYEVERNILIFKAGGGGGRAGIVLV